MSEIVRELIVAAVALGLGYLIGWLNGRDSAKPPWRCASHAWEGAPETATMPEDWIPTRSGHGRICQRCGAFEKRDL